MKTYYATTHEKLMVDGNIATLTISDHAIDELGDIVYIEYPKVGDEIKQGDNIIVIESVKAASDVYAPVTGKILALNSEAESDPSLINQKEPATNWLIKIELATEGLAQCDQLMDEQSYQQSLA